MKYQKIRLHIKIGVFGTDYSIKSHILAYRRVITPTNKSCRVSVYTTRGCNMKRNLYLEWKGTYIGNRDKWNGGGL